MGQRDIWWDVLALKFTTNNFALECAEEIGGGHFRGYLVLPCGRLLGVCEVFV